MGQKVNPHGLRVGVIKDWDSKWYAEADFADLLVEDYNICLLYTSPSPRDGLLSRMPSSA